MLSQQLFGIHLEGNKIAANKVSPNHVRMSWYFLKKWRNRYRSCEIRPM